MKLNLGCGKDIKAGWVNLDRIKLPGVNVIHDISNPLPFKDNTFDEIYAFHVIEHVADRLFILEELWRVSQNGCHIWIRMPDYRSRNAVQDPTHKSLWEFETIDYFIPGHGYNYITKARFKAELKTTNGQEIQWKLRTLK